MLTSSKHRAVTFLIFTLLFAPHATSQIFNILDFGAHKGGSVHSTEAIRAVILAAKAAGGGTVYIPPGNYVTGPIELGSNLVLHIEPAIEYR